MRNLKVMKILLIGRNGQVGFELRRSLAVLGSVFATGSTDCDLNGQAGVRKLVQKYHPDVIVNAAAYTAVDKAEGDKFAAESINALAPMVLAEEAERLGAIFLHFSTDYVFAGDKSGAYVESDTPNPQNVYGETKLAGEQAIKAVCARHIILRTSWVVGAHGMNFAKTMLRLAAEHDSLQIVSDQFGTPTSAALLADLSAHLLRQAMQSVSDEFPFGLYHATASGVTNWHEYACHVINRARTAGKPIRVQRGSIFPVTSTEYPTCAKRPTNSRLNTDKLRNTFNLYLPHWKQGVDHVLDQIF